MKFLHYILGWEKYLPILVQSIGPWIYLLYFGVLFVETGLVIFPFLPGDSILFLGGSLAALKTGGLNIWILIIVSIVASVLGDFVNFEIGKRFGGYIEKSPKWQRFIKKDHLDQAHHFFNKYGNVAIFLGRFMPIIRTLVPFVAGSANMNYRHFVIYNFIGGVCWVVLMSMLGFLFGQNAFVQSHFSLIILAILVISVLPAVILWFQHLLQNKKKVEK